ncbi:MAG: 1-deoxy-D-xylulose-5-phosphate synthase [Betaproteobacteria bacterium TMED82]|nr:MAG: 1-deoxy-D-xylulose-5-phosphate synthase [Betaproteobacteria bacterium TMED82]|tara:strand:+ start:46969 stop:48909 length:1941 start_codon:yes stop_codon:yes gene_type:complete
MNILDSVNCPADVKKLDRNELKTLATELREYLLASVSKSGGHLSSNLGTIELTVAIHYVFNAPFDKLIWDVGHQSYPHKILTGRKRSLSTIRKFGGISGFPKRSESEYDAFGTAHSSTSISAILGMAVAARVLGLSEGENRRRHIAVIGDGALSAGMAFEALNNAGNGNKDLDILVILNDNEMSISPPVGALSSYLARLLTGKIYSSAREISKQFLRVIPPVLEMAKKIEGGAKGLLTPSTLFEEFGFNYFGPIDGHDLDAIVPALRNLRNLKGPQFLHVVTRKGRGYRRAEVDPILYHGPGSFDPNFGIISSKKPKKRTFSQIFGDWLCDVAEQDNKIVGITPAMREGSGMKEFSGKFPDRYFDVGIAEQHAVTFAAGLACDGLRPVVAIYSTFLQRAYDQFIHDVALQNLPVLFAIDRAGLVGADGATHAGSYDLSYLRCVPNITVMAPKDELECRRMLSTALLIKGPSAVRYPRGAGTGAIIDRTVDIETLPVGKAEVCRSVLRGGSGKGFNNMPRVIFLAFGSMVSPCIEVAERIDAAVINMRFVKPIDIDALRDAIVYDLIVTVEENVIAGGAGAACTEVINELSEFSEELHRVPKILNLGLPDRFIDHGDAKELLAAEGLDPKGILESVTMALRSLEKTN